MEIVEFNLFLGKVTLREGMEGTLGAVNPIGCRKVGRAVCFVVLFLILG